MGVFAGLNLFERFAGFPLREGALFGRPMCFRFLKGDLLAAVAEIGEERDGQGTDEAAVPTAVTGLMMSMPLSTALGFGSVGRP